MIQLLWSLEFIHTLINKIIWLGKNFYIFSKNVCSTRYKETILFDRDLYIYYTLIPKYTYFSNLPGKLMQWDHVFRCSKNYIFTK